MKKKYTADYLIEKRKHLWINHRSLEKDKQFTSLVALEICNDNDLKKEIINNPEKLIELCFVIVDKDKNTVPYFFNEVQVDFVKKLNKAIDDYNKGLITDISLLILKGRQQGFTTFVTAYQLSCTILNKNFEGYTLADINDNAESIFQNKAKFMYNHLPYNLKPTEKYNTKRQLIFEKLNSSWSIDSATENVGRSKTINFFHGSECAFWKHGIAKTQAGLGEALTKNAIKIYESTANGFNDFRTMWKSNENINCFYPWWLTYEYKTNFESEKIKNDFLNNINKKSDWIYNRLKWLMNDKKLLDTQLYWYFNKYNKYIDKELIKQEYPCSEDEAFLSSGNCYFDKEIVINRLMKLENMKPLKIGYFSYKFKNNKISNIIWVDDEKGYIKIYEDFKNGHPYVLGGDTAGEGSDNFTGQVIDNSNGYQVATLKRTFDEDEYARQIYCLGMYYNEALIGIENNYSTYPTKKLKEYNYPNIYIRESEDNIADKIQDKYGFVTNKATRPIILGILKEVFRDNIDWINDIDTLKEGSTFIKNEKGRAEAQSGEHDDLIMGLAITYYIRTQQRYTILIENKEDNIKIPVELQDEGKIEEELIGW